MTVHRIVLWLVAAYHIGMGLLAFCSNAAAIWLARQAFGVALDGSEQVMYLARLVGLYGVAFGVFVAFMAVNPVRYARLVYAVLLLYALRVIDRAVFLPGVKESFQIATPRIVVGCVLLAAFGVAVWFTRPRPAADDSQAGA